MGSETSEKQCNMALHGIKCQPAHQAHDCFYGVQGAGLTPAILSAFIAATVRGSPDFPSSSVLQLSQP
jgi:hypothetical protein